LKVAHVYGFGSQVVTVVCEVIKAFLFFCKIGNPPYIPVLKERGFTAAFDKKSEAIFLDL
jgi:hypothetical protein